MPSFKEFFFGSKDKLKKLPTMAPNQQNQFNQAVDNPIDQNPLYQSGSSYLQKILSGDPSAFEAFENPLIEQFQQKIIPMLSSQFAGQGTGAGGLNSSGFQQTLGEAGKGLSTNLAQIRANMQGQAANQALGYAQQPYNNAYAQAQISPFAYANQPGSQGFIQNAAGPLLQAAGQGLGMGPLANYMSNMWGGGQQQHAPAQLGWSNQPGSNGYANVGAGARY